MGNAPGGKHGKVCALILLLIAGLGPKALSQIQMDAAWEMRVCADPVSLPFSSQDESGFENRIAAILANELHASVTYDWHLFNSDMINERLREGECDLIMGIPDGYKGLLTTLAYYQSPYVFVYREDSSFDVTSLDDPVLSQLRIGVQSIGIPPYLALLRRGLEDNVVAKYGTRVGTADHLSELVNGVVQGDIDLGLAWGPVAGYYAKQQDVRLKLVPVTPVFEPPATFMSTPMTIGVRPGDESLRDRLNIAIAHRWDDIQAVLSDYGVQLDPLPKPVVTSDMPSSDAKGALNIGFVIPTSTGASAVHASLYDIVGEAARMGALLADEDLGTAAGSSPPKVLIASSPSANAARRAAARLVATEGVSALVGGLGAGQGEVLADLAKAHHVLFLNIGSPDAALRQACNPYLFHIEASDGMYLDALVMWFSNKGEQRWFIVYENSAEGTARHERALDALAKASGTEVVGSAAVDLEQPTYIPELNAVEAAGADAVLLLVKAADQIAFLSQLNALGLELTVAPFPDPVTQTRDFLAAANFRYGAAGVEERAALWDTTLQADGAADLNARFTSRWGKPMDPPAWAAYAAVNILEQAATDTGSTEPEALAEHLLEPDTAFDVHKGAGVSFRAWDHQLRQPLYIVTIEPEAEWGLQVSKQVALASVAGTLPHPNGDVDAVALLDRLGDGVDAVPPNCRE